LLDLLVGRTCADQLSVGVKREELTRMNERRLVDDHGCLEHARRSIDGSLERDVLDRRLGLFFFRGWAVDGQ